MREKETGEMKTNQYAEAAKCGSVGIDRGCRVSLKEQMEKRLARSRDQSETASRILDILERHPEFEEYDQLRELMDQVRY